MSSRETRMIRSAKPPERNHRSRTERAHLVERDLDIADPAGHRRYLGRPCYFGPLDPSSLDDFFVARSHLERAQQRGASALEATLSRYGLTSVEQWWHIEASFYQHHMIEVGALPTAPRRRRTPDGTPAPELLAMTRPTRPVPEIASEAPVPFEVFCEIAGAQAAWSAAGFDPALEASRHFLLEIEELIAVELYWANELGKCRELARQFARKMLDYKTRFSGG